MDVRPRKRPAGSRPRPRLRGRRRRRCRRRSSAVVQRVLYNIMNYIIVATECACVPSLLYCCIYYYYYIIAHVFFR